MKALKTLILGKSIAAAFVAAAGVAAPAISHASPDDGMVCRSGYSAQFAGGNLKCSKQLVRFIALECTNTRFPNKVIRVAGIQGDTSGGRDMCLRPGIVLSSNAPATGLTAGQDFVFVAVNQTRVVAVREATERNEETALGLGLDGVDSRSAGTVDVNGGIGAEDRVRADLTLFTFAIPAPTLLRLPLQIDRPIIDLGPRLLP
jgi:hypothetical protein